MRKINVVVFALFLVNLTFAQKFGYVDTQYILEKMPEYKEAQAEIEKLATGWEKEIQDLYQEVEQMEVDLRAEEVLLTKEMWEARAKDAEGARPAK